MYKPGDRIGPFTLIRKIGKGSFGIVWLAEKRTSIITREFALKLTRDDDIDLKAFEEEAVVWSQAGDHTNILPILEAEIYDDRLVIITEYASGGSLSDWLERHGGRAPDIEAAVDIASGILAGLHHLHTRHIIHRDLKPENILLQGDTPRIADFGMARVLKSSSQSAFIRGTAAYMAPEALKGKRSEQTDVWAAGVVLYQLVSGRLPFPQKDRDALMFAIVWDEPMALPVDVPGPFQKIISRSLQKSLDTRYKSAAEMRKALREATRFFIGASKQTLDEATIDSYRDEQPTIVLSDQATIVRPQVPPTAGTRLVKENIGYVEAPIEAPPQMEASQPDRLAREPAPESMLAEPLEPEVRVLKATPPPLSVEPQPIVREAPPEGHDARMNSPIPEKKRSIALSPALPVIAAAQRPPWQVRLLRPKPNAPNLGARRGIRIYDLARELRLDNKTVIDNARREGLDVTLPSNWIPLEMAERIRNKVRGDKIRIYDLATELKLDNRSVMEAVRREGIDVSVPSNTVPFEVAERIRYKYYPIKVVAPILGPRLIKRIKQAAPLPKTESPRKSS
jgi:serine/threonine protein kinase